MLKTLFSARWENINMLVTAALLSLALTPAPVSAEVMGAVDSYELPEGVDLTGWTVLLAQAPSGPIVQFCGYDAQAAFATAMAPDGIEVVTAPMWFVDTIGTHVNAEQPLGVTAVNDCTNMPGIWLLNMSPL